MAQQVKSVAHLSKDLNLIPGSHVMIYIQSSATPEPKTSSGLYRYHAYTCYTENMCPRTKNKNCTLLSEGDLWVHKEA